MVLTDKKHRELVAVLAPLKAAEEHVAEKKIRWTLGSFHL
jgi:hypothetical protein